MAAEAAAGADERARRPLRGPARKVFPAGGRPGAARRPRDDVARRGALRAQEARGFRLQARAREPRGAAAARRGALGRAPRARATARSAPSSTDAADRGAAARRAKICSPARGASASSARSRFWRVSAAAAAPKTAPVGGLVELETFAAYRDASAVAMRLADTTLSDLAKGLRGVAMRFSEPVALFYAIGTLEAVDALHSADFPRRRQAGQSVPDLRRAGRRR